MKYYVVNVMMMRTESGILKKEGCDEVDMGNNGMEARKKQIFQPSTDLDDDYDGNYHDNSDINNYDDNSDVKDDNYQDLFAGIFLIFSSFNYWLPACLYKGTALRDKLPGFVRRKFIFVFLLVLYLYEINYPDLSDCLYLL